MICTFCGTENLAMNRFCGMCGARLERRKAERRVNPSGSMKCASCGHVNEPGYKFCGMCGVNVDRRMQERRGAAGKSRATAVANAELPGPYRPAVQRQPFGTATRTPVVEREPVRSGAALHEERRVAPAAVSGPSFLGLNDPDAEAQYLLEDEKSPRRGLRTLILMIILAVIAGLAYVQWKANLQANPKPLEPPKPEPASVPRQGKNEAPQILKTPQMVAGAHELQAGTAAVMRNAASTAEPEKNSNATPKKPDKLARNPAPAKDVEDDPPETASDPAANVSNKPSPALVKAQRYLQGRGVRQNCEQGMVYLKAATEENDPRAAVQMGALYSSGFCVQQDRVKAYQWFSSARDMDPNNRWISKNLSQLWAQMTPAERRRIRSNL